MNNHDDDRIMALVASASDGNGLIEFARILIKIKIARSSGSSRRSAEVPSLHLTHSRRDAGGGGRGLVVRSILNEPIPSRCVPARNRSFRTDTWDPLCGRSPFHSPSLPPPSSPYAVG